MSYQEYLITSSKRNIKDCEQFLTDKLSKNHMHLDVIGSTKVNQEISANKMTIFGKTHDIDTINLKKGEEFVIIAGEKPMNNVKNLFPLRERRYVKAIPLDHIMFSTEIEGKPYEDFFKDKETSPEKDINNSVIVNEPVQVNKKIEADLIDTNIGKVPIDELNDILAIQNGFDSYQEMRSQGYMLPGEEIKSAVVDGQSTLFNKMIETDYQVAVPMPAGMEM